ncbi:MAG: apolipoprotein N-acyltransferase [Sulfurovaceae bacterium]|nr:apolipoprotein N-acyltransferase [Sulfurovaceae bacterium]
MVNTILGILTFYYLLKANSIEWFWSGFFIGSLWFWWICISFFNYGFPWAIPIGVAFIGFVYGILFLAIAKISEYIPKKFSVQNSNLLILIIKSISILLLSYIHPIEFDWFKPEMVFTNSYIGIQKWQFAITLIAIIVSIYKKNLLFLFIVILAFPFTNYINQTPLPKHSIALANSNITVDDKWNPKLLDIQIDRVFKLIDRAISDKKKIIVFPESILPIFLNTKPNLMTELEAYSNNIAIVIGALYYNQIPRNSTYIFNKGSFLVANKVVLVPFGEQNPLPEWMGKIINKIFFDGAPDYVADSEPTDYIINGVTYRNAICFEGTSRELYTMYSSKVHNMDTLRDEKSKGIPKEMIVISNNGWVVPSIEPIEQKILLQFYSKKYDTTIYHAVNMSSSYIVHNGKVYR